MWSYDLVVSGLFHAVAYCRDVFEGVKDRNEVGEGLTGSIVGVDYCAEIFKVLLEGDREGFCLDEGGLFEVVVVEHFDDLALKGILVELSFFVTGLEIVLVLFVHGIITIN